jgi:asparagine synthase (glutamine-hydrolysing)
MIVEPDSINIISTLVDAYDEPFADASSIPTYFLSKYTREFVTVALSGDGGDELFAGYNNYARLLRYKQNHINLPIINKLIYGTLYSMYPDFVRGKRTLYLLSRNTDLTGAFLTHFNPMERKILFKNKILHNDHYKQSESIKIELIRNSSATEYLSKYQELDINTYLVEDILAKVDRASMMNSLEVRVPLLDHKFVELACRIPANLKLRNNVSKYILKESMKTHLPEEILTHKKQGFAIPLKYWLRNDSSGYVLDNLTHDPDLYTFINKKFVLKLIKNHNKGMRDYSERIWDILIFQAWLRKNKGKIHF